VFTLADGPGEDIQVTVGEQPLTAPFRASGDAVCSQARASPRPQTFVQRGDPLTRRREEELQLRKRSEMRKQQRVGRAALWCLSAMLLALLPMPTRSAPRTGAAPPQQAASQDCEKIKEEIRQLQDAIANISAQMQIMQQSLDRINKDIAQLQQGVKFFSGTGLSETARGEALDQLAKAMNDRTRMEQDLEDAANTIQAFKDAIAELLNKLASCGPPSTTQPPKEETPKAQPTPPSATPQKNKTLSTSAFTPTIQFRGFGGATFVSGNTPAAAGFDGAVLFPLGNRVLVGPTAGFEWVDSSIVKTIGGGPPPSTFANESVGFKTGNFGGRIAFPFGGWQLGVHAGATVASSKITQNEGFCGTSSTNPTAPPTCTVTSSSTTHDTVVGPFVGGYISHSIFPHVGVFVEYDYRRLKDTKSSVSVFDLHDNDVVAGIVLSFGRHKVK
jgi:hypothetical protein